MQNLKAKQVRTFQEIQEIKLKNGLATYAIGRTIMSETGLPADTLVEYVGSQSREKGTAQKNSLYHIIGTDDLLRIRHNDGTSDNLTWDNIEIVKDYFAKQRSYGNQVKELARKYHLPFNVGLVLGTEEVKYQFLKNIVSDVDFVTIGTFRDLEAGIDRRKRGLRAVLGDEFYEWLSIDELGQLNSQRLALYIRDKCLARINA